MAAKKKGTTAKSDKKAAKPKAKPTTQKAVVRKPLQFPIVGIGASAGGLEALEGLFQNTPNDIGMAFVIIQHLAPEHKSIMGTLLKKYTDLEVLEVTDGMKIKPNCIYLNPPNKEVGIMGGTLLLSGPVTSHAVRLPIDHFLRSLADDQVERSVCIILSGTGSDGTLGVRAIKGAGGIAIAQTEDQAKYDSMPKNAIDTGMVDYVLPVEKMAAELIKCIEHPFIAGQQKMPDAKESFETNLQQIYMLIRSATGHDFSHYKQNTITRRIERRMTVHQIKTVDDYLLFMRENPAEVTSLFKDLLITVTNFFRDPGAFDVLEKKVIPEIISRKHRDMPVRIWVPGCATGEEAYSIAILFVEAMERAKKHVDVQIFATDIDEKAIEHARAGLYPNNIAGDLTPARLKRFFISEENKYRIRKQIREMVVFAVQNLIKDAPFSKLDMVSCRNLLIYMDSVLQKKVIPLLHYTLNPGGYMFLGTSETVGKFSDCFAPVDLKWKVFKRKDIVLNKRVEHLVTPFYEIQSEKLPVVSKGLISGTVVRELAERTILQDYSLPCVLVDESFNVLYFCGDTQKYLKMPTGEPTFNILKMARQDLRYKLNTVLRKALSSGETASSKDVSITHNGEMLTFDIIVRPMVEPVTGSGMMMVIFECRTPAPKQEPKKKKNAKEKIDPQITSLEQELQSTKEYLQTTIEELETSNEELNSTNEELQSTNEELQSTNEELETSREELQSTNEEIATVNAELQGKVDELYGVNNDLSNLLASTQVGTIFLDNDLNIKRFTPMMTDYFKLISTDIGRPIGDIVNNLKYDSLLEDVKEVLQNLGRQEVEMQTTSGKWVLMRVMPYRTLENAIDGVVMTFINITRLKEAELDATFARDYAESIVRTVRHPLIVMDDKFRIVSANKSFYDKFKADSHGTVGKSLFELGNRQWDIPRFRKLLEEVLPSSTDLLDFRVEHDFPDIGHKVMLLNARRVLGDKENMQKILLAIEDVTDTIKGRL